jgi:hypothetical protein
MLRYDPAQEKALALDQSGPGGLVTGWTGRIAERLDEVLFGYGVLGKNRPLREGGERGVVLLYLPESVT